MGLSLLDLFDASQLARNQAITITFTCDLIHALVFVDKQTRQDLLDRRPSQFSLEILGHYKP